MIISKLSLYNFGVYSGINEFEFTAQKPIVLIGGLNGRGKTTFLEAVLLALYGKNSFAYSESDGLSYGQYLRDHVNMSDGKKETYVDLTFFMDKEGKEKYRVRREWDAKTSRTTEKTSVYKDDEYNQFLTDNWAMFMENVLPSGLSSFFFFDGEKIATLAGENTSAQMKQSIKVLLGITVLDHLENDLSRIISRTAKNSVNKEEEIELENLRAAKDDANKKLQEIDSMIEELQAKSVLIQKNLDKANEEYVVKGGDLITQRQDMINKRSILNAKVQALNDDLMIAAGSELPLLLVKDLLQNIREKAEIIQDRKTLEVALNKMKKELSSYTQKTGHDSEAIDLFLDFFEKKYKGKESNYDYNISDSGLAQLQLLLDKRLLNNKLDTITTQTDVGTIEKEANQIESYLSVDIDEKAVATLYKKIKRLEQEKAEIEAKLDVMQEKRRTAKGLAVSTASDFNRKVESYLKKVELNDDGDRIIKYANIANSVIIKYRVALQASKVDEVASTMTKCYKLLASKKSLIDRIKMDASSLDMIYLNEKGEEVPRKSLSAGEKQMMVIALLWSLAICSKKHLPVIIDTPLSRLDSLHRQAMVSVYFPKASDQTIILSTDSEIDMKTYEMMKDDVGDEFTLNYDEETKSTSIETGYFVGREK